MQTYTYDGFHRLLTAETEGSHWGLSWSYDRYGNRLSQTVTKGTPSHSISVDAQSNRMTGWTYDQAGNTLNDGSHSYAYDANNRITSLDAGSTLYRYDAGGSRVQKVTASQTTSYFFGIAEHVSGQGWSRLYIKLGNEKLVEYSGNTTHFFHADHRFTPRVRTDLSGVAGQTWDDLPFGEVWQSTGGGNDQHRLTGHMRDSESGNDYAGARHYSNQKGRWLGVDPWRGGFSSPQSWNRFSYALNDPVNHADKGGRMPTLVEERCTTVRNGPPESGPSGGSGATISVGVTQPVATHCFSSSHSAGAGESPLDRQQRACRVVGEIARQSGRWLATSNTTTRKGSPTTAASWPSPTITLETERVGS